jgi:uncharacterized protein (TIGR02147 family)
MSLSGVPFSCSDYRSLIQAWLHGQPKRGHGQQRVMADRLRIPTPVFSQILSGKRELSEDQAYVLSEHFGFGELEREYFLCLVQIERAHFHAYKTHLRERLAELKERSQNLQKRLSFEKMLSEKDQSEFYSHWIYSAVRLFCGIGSAKNLDEIMSEFSLERPRAQQILQFLVQTGLVELESGRYKMGPARTHVGKDSPFVSRHLTNWRIRAIERAHNLAEDELMFSGPMSLSKKDLSELREKMLSWIQEVSSVVKDSPPEALACFNLDLFRIK